MLTLWAEVNLSLLRENLRTVRKVARASSAEVLAIVKADAYGHGMKAVAKTLAAEGVDFFGVANLDEAMELRKVCPKAKILVLGSFHKGQLPDFLKSDIIPIVSGWEDVRAIARFLQNRRIPFAVHVKIDTGMGRLGIWHLEAAEFFEKIRRQKNIFVEGIFTHFSSADKKDEVFTKIQLSRFNQALETASQFGLKPRYIHAANSLGILRFKDSHFNLIRPGIILYGINPGADPAWKKGLSPILELKARIAFLKEVAKEQPISYGASFITSHRTRIAVLPVGYSHGYRIGFSNKASIIVGGKRCPVVGQVTMDQTMLDLSGVPQARRWDPVTLIGQEGQTAVLVEELASLAETIPYEILCSLHSRIPRIYKGLEN